MRDCAGGVGNWTGDDEAIFLEANDSVSSRCSAASELDLQGFSEREMQLLFC